MAHFEPRSFWKEDEAQDLVEYSLLLALLALVVAVCRWRECVNNLDFDKQQPDERKLVVGYEECPP